MQDSSPFRWLEERGPACQLIALIDDATSRVWARFTEHDTTEENCEPWGDGCDATGVRWPITPIKTASFARQVLRRSPNNSGEKPGRAPSSDGHLANCGSNGSRHKVRRRKGASSDCSRPSRTAW